MSPIMDNGFSLLHGQISQSPSHQATYFGHISWQWNGGEYGGMASGMNSILSVEPSFLYVFSVKMCCHHIYSNKRPGRLFSFLDVF